MEFVCRAGRWEDMPRLLEIEKGATPGLLYLDDVKDEFFDPNKGELIVAEADGVPMGFVHFSLQADGAAWLETLRVDPAYQKKGCGTALWQAMMAAAEKYRVPAMRMYTGRSNVASYTLARRNGLDIAAETLEATLLAENAEVTAVPVFEPLDFPQAAALLSKHWAGYDEVCCLNRTFYKGNAATVRMLCEEGMVYGCGESVLVLGRRFKNVAALHIGLLGGDVAACLAFAKQKLLETGLSKLVCMIPMQREDLKAALVEAGFTVPERSIIMMARTF
ncbi:MAG: GNAT family N-acetyltransferase [Clostridia bacterium]|nr:GNAT family N-acetyltransferase [Clostridia bacterium]